MIYLICFLISLLLMTLSFKFGNKNQLIKKILLIISLLLPCILASLRDYTIGTDVNIYINPLYVLAKNYGSFFSYYNSVNIVRDFSYLLITYMAAKIGSIGLLFFFIELLIIFPLYHSMELKFNNKKAIIFGFIIFYLFFYNQTLNMARQSIAISFVIYGLSNLEIGKDKKALAMFFIASTFHNTASISFIIYLIFKLYYKGRLMKIYTKKELLYDLMLIITSISVLFFVKYIIYIIGGMGIISTAKINNYSVTYYRETLDFSFINTFIYFVVFITLWHYKEKLKKVDKYQHFYLIMSIISVILLQLGMIIAFSDRIVYYIFYPVLFLELPLVFYNNNEKITKNTFYYKIIIILLFLIYWIYWIVVINYNGTYPYIFRSFN